MLLLSDSINELDEERSRKKTTTIKDECVITELWAPGYQYEDLH